MANSLFEPMQGDSDGVDDSFGTVFAGILSDMQQNYHGGTAGCSLVSARYAAIFMDLFTEDKPEADIIRQQVLSLEETLTADEREEFPAQLQEIAAAAEGLFEEGGEAVLSDCGYEPIFYPWDYEAMSACFEAMQLA